MTDKKQSKLKDHESKLTVKKDLFQLFTLSYFRKSETETKPGEKTKTRSTRKQLTRFKKMIRKNIIKN